MIVPRKTLAGAALLVALASPLVACTSGGSTDIRTPASSAGQPEGFVFERGEVRKDRFFQEAAAANEKIKTFSLKSFSNTTVEGKSSQATSEALVDQSDPNQVNTSVTNKIGSQTYQLVTVNGQTWVKRGENWEGPTPGDGLPVPSLNNFLKDVNKTGSAKKITYREHDDKGHHFTLELDVNKLLTGKSEGPYENTPMEIWFNDDFQPLRGELLVKTQVQNANVTITQDDFNKELTLEPPKTSKPLAPSSFPSK